ncbi:vacuolar protein sorting-associated protein 54 [Neobacillus niacini]|uniref:vacuolar protein sorting-associated protein 54 n=1 Tax=Neobacillus niacini TaxID=86668 RepID=UPI0021CB238E|nr:vacuolar protein sorting-associated protein 54 [Neobacillus niacini]MCM3764557.1 vacuolar protein sorting-associated protein 54 [Neobacillus niacini]
MGWAEFRSIRNDYNDHFKEIDEKLLQLLHERKKLANGKRFFPSSEQMEKWAEQYEIEMPQVSWFFHSVNEGPHSYVPEGPGELLNVIPIMKKTTVGDFQYLISHAMQHQNGSIITVEIEQLDREKNLGMIRSHLILEVAGSVDYQVHRHGVHGRDGQTQIEFLVTRRLPDQLDGVAFALMPYAMPMEERPKEVILDKEVYF